MLKKLSLTAVAVAVAAGGLAVATGPAAAAKPTVNAGPGSDVDCVISGKVTIKPKLMADWKQSEHQSDPNVGNYGAVIAAIPDTPFADHSTPANTSFKGKGTCTGNVTDGTNTIPVQSVKVTLTNVAETTENSCSGLTDLALGDSTFQVELAWKSSGGKVIPTSIAGIEVAVGSSPNGGFGFALSGGTVTGSFAGGDAESLGIVDLGTAGAITGNTVPTSQNPAPGVCQPTLQLKTKMVKNPEDPKGPKIPQYSAKLKKPKGFGKITIGQHEYSGPDQSTFSISR